jgi:hypothetical protein
MNDDFYIHYIDTIKDKINIYNDNKFNKETFTKKNVTKTESEQQAETLIKTPPLKKKYKNSSEQQKIRDDTMQLNNLLWKQTLANYRDTQKKLNRNINYVPKEYTIIDNEDELLESIKKESYKTTWNRLDKYQKKEKITEYINDLFTKNMIIEETYNQIVQSIQDIIKKGSSKKIIYDNKSKIESIWCISFNKNDNKYVCTL